MIFPEIKVVPSSELPFTTLGHWAEDEPGRFRILILDIPDWRYTLIVLAHELTEWAVCQRDGVSTADCDRFDEWFEQEYKAGRKTLDQEAGCDKGCPYHKGHMWGIRVERFLCWLLGLRWHEYCRVCQVMIDNMWAASHEA